MSHIVLKAENISKQYRLGQLGTGTISHDLNRFWAKLRGKEDPYLKVGDVNDRSLIGGSDYVWSLKDINFEVKQGEVLGIIGKNGAGKSTLLKILSQVTTPTTGEVKVKGRIASLLEVGTGFHHELSGRENIFLNGAILGMTKIEIKSKLDEIVEFSGVAKYLDTPVKRYSSGMMVRLAFAVAAHLEPEILIVDEVLAVGDQEFQDKCIGKMKDVSSQGRTVIFVSHNMAAIKSLCGKAIILANGKLVEEGSAEKLVNNYLSEYTTISSGITWPISEAPGNENFKLTKLELINDGKQTNNVDISKDTTLKIYYKNFTDNKRYQISVHIIDNQENCIVCAINAPSASIEEDKYFHIPYAKGEFVTEFSIPGNFLNEMNYHLSVFFSHNVFTTNELALEKIISFNTFDAGSMKKDFTKDWGGIVRPKMHWSTKQIL